MYSPLQKRTSKRFIVAVDFGSSGSGFSILLVHDINNLPNPFRGYPHCPTEFPDTTKNLTAYMYEKGFGSLWGYSAKHKLIHGDDDDDSDEDEEVGSKKYSAETSEEVYIDDLKIKFMRNAVEEFAITTDGFKTKSIKNIIADYLRTMLKQCIMPTIHKTDNKATLKDIRWCFSVPSNYTDNHKHMMREIAFNAGFIEVENASEDDFLIVTEPEAATIFCTKYLGRNLKEGESVMVVDAGGGTVDVSCHKINEGRLREMTIQKGSVCGSKIIDGHLLSLIENEFGFEFKNFKTQYPESFDKLLLNWEKAKRTIKAFENIHFDVPPMFVEFFKDSNSSMLAPKKHLLKLSKEQVERMFTESIHKTYDIISEQLEEYRTIKFSKVDHLFLVGGLSSNKLFQESIKEKFKGDFKEIVIPQFCDTAVLQGASILGKDPSLIRSRKAKLTYGISTMTEFNEDYHPEDKLRIEDGKFYCDHLFEVFVEKGDEVPEDMVQEKEFFALPKFNYISIILYVSPKRKKDVPFVDSKFVSRLQEITIKFPANAPDRRVFVKMHFGKSEIFITVENAHGEKKNAHQAFEADSLVLH